MLTVWSRRCIFVRPEQNRKRKMQNKEFLSAFTAHPRPVLCTLGLYCAPSACTVHPQPVLRVCLSLYCTFRPYCTPSACTRHPQSVLWACLRLRSHDDVMIWKRNKIITKGLLFTRCRHENLLKTVRNENGTLIGNEMKTELYPASCEHLSIRNRIMTVPSQWCRFQVIPASCERGLSLCCTP